MERFEELELDDMIKEVMQEALGEEDDTTTDDIDEGQQIDPSTDGDADKSDSDGEEESGDESYEDDDAEEYAEADVKEGEEEESDSTFSPITVNFRGSPITLESKDELQKYLNRTSQLGTQTPMQQALEQAGLSVEELQLLVDAKSGNKAAIAKLIVDGKVDTEEFDLADADKYEAQWKPEIMSEADRVAQDIGSDPEWKENVTKTFSQVPSDFAEAIVGNAAALQDFAGHVKSGLAEKIIPQAKKKMALEGIDFATAYTQIGSELLESGYTPISKPKRKLNAKADEMKKKATKRSTRRKPKTEVDSEDVWNMSDEDFAKEFGIM